MISDKKNICFYCYSPELDSGHIKTIIRLADTLKKTNRYNLFLILNSKNNLFKKELLSVFNNILFLKNIKDNTRFTNRFISEYPPNIFITEFFPFGRTQIEDEIKYIIKKLKKNKTKILSAIPMPYFTHSEKDLNKLIENLKYYNRIIIFTPSRDIKYFVKAISFENRIKPLTFIKLFNSIKNKIYFAGYIIDNDVKHIKEKKKHILVTNGAGSVLKKIITISIKAKKYIPETKMNVIPGISTDKREMRIWQKMIKDLKIKNIKLIKYVKNLIPYIKESEVIISSAGSTSYEILRYSKKAILIPYEGKPNHEHSDQIARANMLRELINSSVLREKELSVKRLVYEINKKLNESKVDYKSIKDFNGKSNFYKIIESYAKNR